MKKILKKVCVLGHFGFGENMLNGQTIKTKSLATELEKQFGKDNVLKVDTHGGLKELPKILLELFNGFKSCENVIILPAHNGIKIFVPVCNIYNKIFHRRTHYAVVGGWLNQFIEKHSFIKRCLYCFEGIYVETYGMKDMMEKKGFHNIYVMANFKELNILQESSLVFADSEPFRLCTFSRVMKEKGIEEAIRAVESVNKTFGRTVYTLDIYGQVDSLQIDWFENLKNTFPEYISYKGFVPFEQSVDVLKSYFALVFPTYYDGEGFAGTLVDAMAAGIPVIASNWKYNNEIVVEHQTGLLVEYQSALSIKYALLNIMKNIEVWNNMKYMCITEAKKYTSDKAIQPLITNL